MNEPVSSLISLIEATSQHEEDLLSQYSYRLLASSTVQTAFTSPGEAVGAIIGIIYIFAFVYYLSIKFFNHIIEDLVYLVNYKEDEDKEVYRPIIYCILNSIPVFVFNISCVVESDSDGGVMLIFATDMVNICLIFGIILIFAILPKKQEGSDVDGWLLLRDTLYYIIGLISVILLIYFDLVAWWSGLLLVLYWLIHLIILSNNEGIRDQIYLLVGLKHEDDSFNADEQVRQKKRRVSITELSYKNLIDNNDEQLKKKIMRMDALLKVKYAQEAKKKELLSIWQVAVYTVMFSIRNKHKEEKIQRSVNYGKLLAPSKEASELDEEEKSNYSELNQDGIKNEEDRLIEKGSQLKGSKSLKGIEDDNEGRGARIHNDEDTDKDNNNFSKKADTINSHKLDENPDRVPEYQSENDVKPNTLLRGLNNNNDNLTNKENLEDDNNNQKIIDIPEITNNPDLNNNNNINGGIIGQTTVSPDKFSVGLAFPTGIIDQICYVIFFPIHLIIFILPNYHINPSHRKLAASFFITVMIMSGLMVALQYLMDNLNGYFDGHNSAYSLSITAFFLQIAFFTYNYQFAKKEKDPIDFLLTFIQLGIYKIGVVLGITIIFSAIFSLNNSTDIVFNDNFFVVLIIIGVIVLINAILIRIMSLKANRIVAYYLIFAYAVFLISGIILLAY